MPRKFTHPDTYIYGAELVRNINAARAEAEAAKAEPDPEPDAFADTLRGFQAFASPETSPTEADRGDGEPDPQGDSAANEKEN